MNNKGPPPDNKTHTKKGDVIYRRPTYQLDIRLDLSPPPCGVFERGSIEVPSRWLMPMKSVTLQIANVVAAVTSLGNIFTRLKSPKDSNSSYMERWEKPLLGYLQFYDSLDLVSHYCQPQWPELAAEANRLRGKAFDTTKRGKVMRCERHFLSLLFSSCRIGVLWSFWWLMVTFWTQNRKRGDEVYLKFSLSNR